MMLVLYDGGHDGDGDDDDDGWILKWNVGGEEA
jgi:hypothetical protein